MDTIWFIDPGYGQEWEFTGGERINSNGNPANPYAKISFRGENCTAFCTSMAINTSMGFLNSIEKGYARQNQLKFSVYCKDMASGGDFSMGFTQNKTKSAPDYFGITISGGSYNITFPATPSSGTLTGNLSDGYHNISLMLYINRTATNAYNHTYRMAVDDKLVYGTKSGSSAIPVLYLGAWFPPAEAGKFFISNVIYGGVTDASITDSTDLCDKQVIPPNTQLMPLKLGEPEDISFTPSSSKEGEYIGYLSGDKLLQTIDATDLINGNEATKTKSYGEGAKVDTVVVYGNPAYVTSDFTGKVYGVLGDTKTLGTSRYRSKATNATYCIDIGVEEGTTLGEINGKLAGWEIG